MRDLATRALDLAQVLGASYADVRIEWSEVQTLVVKNGVVAEIDRADSQGFGVRVVVDGAWGFASSARLEPAEIDRVTALAVEVGRASALVRSRPVDLGPPVTSRGVYRTPVVRDPFGVSLDEKLRLLLSADAAARSIKGVTVAETSLECVRVRKLFANSEGALVEQEIVETGAGLEVLAVGDGEAQKRSYPNSFGRHQGTAGYEFVEGLDLVGNAPRVAEEAVRLLTADPCPTEVTTVILDGTQMALQVHESCGHPIELDRVFGEEASYAGTSFLTLEKRGSFRYGSEVVNITADATSPTGLGTYGWDDEGVPAQRVPIVTRGVFQNYLMSRETAARLGLPSNGCMRAEGWNRLPLIRMTNINLEPGPWRLEDLIADTDRGIFMATNKSWSIDDKRLNFQFGTEIAWEIRNGKLGRMLKNPSYTGITPEFWRSCDAVCREWRLWGVTNCGKGEPAQGMHVGHGAAPARFRNVQVGVVR